MEPDEYWEQQALVQLWQEFIEPGVYFPTGYCIDSTSYRQDLSMCQEALGGMTQTRTECGPNSPPGG